MRHGRKNKRFGYGQDSDQMLIRKLLQNFVEHGSMTTTAVRAKYIKAKIDRLVTYAKKNNNSGRDSIMSKIADKRLTDKLITVVAPSFDKVAGGYVSTKRLMRRDSDGTLMMSMKWSRPVVEVKAATPVEVKTPVVKTESVQEAESVVEKKAVTKKEAAPKKAAVKKS
jgi:large subunit ribosomal protein L17